MRRVERVAALIPDPQDARIALVVHEVFMGEIDPADIDDPDQDILADPVEGLVLPFRDRDAAVVERRVASGDGWGGATAPTGIGRPQRLTQLDRLDRWSALSWRAGRGSRSLSRPGRCAE